MIELRQLQHFLAIVEQGGIRHAARRLELSPSAVARSVNALETSYGVSLLARHGKRVEPTAFGRQLADEARAVLANVEGIGHRLGQLVDLEHGTLRVALSPAVADVFLPRVGARILREKPGVSIETRQGHATEALAWLVGREVDIAVGHESPLAVHGGLDVVTLYTDQVSLWTREAHPLARRANVQLGDLVDFPLLSQFMPPGFAAWFEGVLEAAAKERSGHRVNRAQQCSSYFPLVSMALESDAVLLATDLTMRAGSGADRLERLHIPEVEIDVTMAAAVLRSPSPAPLAHVFIERMQEEVTAVRRSIEVHA